MKPTWKSTGGASSQSAGAGGPTDTADWKKKYEEMKKEKETFELVMNQKVRVSSCASL